MRIAKTEVQVKTMLIEKARNLAILIANSIPIHEERNVKEELLNDVFRNTRNFGITKEVDHAQETVALETREMVKTGIGSVVHAIELAERIIP